MPAPKRICFFSGFSQADDAEEEAGEHDLAAEDDGQHRRDDEAQQAGLVSRVVANEELDAALEETLADFRKASPLVMRMNVRMIKRLEGKAFEDARVEAERVFLDELMKTEDVQEGIASFFEKRRPEWKNR